MKISKRLKKSAREAALAVLMLTDLVCWRSGVLFWAVVVYFLVDYLRYRREASLNFKHSQTIRKSMTLADIRAIEEEYTHRSDFDTFEKRAAIRPPLERHFYLGRYRRVQQMLDRYAAGAGRILDLGCGFGIHTLYILRHLHIPVVGLELNPMKMMEAARAFQLQPAPAGLEWVCGDAARPPFKEAGFDCILCTEVLEHLLEPAAGLAACRDLLRTGGLLLLTTPSSHNLDYSNNPFMVAEKILSLAWDRVLPPYHNLHAQFEFNWKKPEPAYGIHYHFSRQQLARLLRRNGFETVWWGSYEVEVLPFLLVELLARGNVDVIARRVDPLERLAEKIPLLARLGQHLLWVARKTG